MRRGTVLLAAASLIYVVAWFMPVDQDGTTLAKGGLPGWEALQFSLSPDTTRPWWKGVLFVLSGLTNGWFLFSVAAHKVRPGISKRILFWGSLLAALINTQWFVLSDSSGRAQLRIGYYLWFASFLLLAAAARRTLNGSATTRPARAAA